MRTVVVDLETTVYNRGEGAVGKFAASPFHKGNKSYLSGCLLLNSEGAVEFHRECFSKGLADFGLRAYPTLLVGHNIGFDLHYLLKHSRAIDLKNLYVWDTALVEYLLSGQDKMFPSLDECCLSRGWAVKPDKIKDYWEQGIDTEDIPEHELEEYLHHDVTSTARLYLDQKAALKNLPKLQSLVAIKMDDLLSTVIMERNGMMFDSKGAMQEAEKLQEQVLEATQEALDCAMLLHGSQLHKSDINLASSQQLSAIIFGGTFTVTRHQGTVDENGEPVLYKTGKKKGTVKTKKVKRDLKLKASFAADPEWISSKPGVYSTDNSVLTTIANVTTMGPLGKLVENILLLRKLQKDISTYYIGYTQLTWPDGRIHPSLNHTATATGRLSCTNPNLQNVTSGD